MFWLNTFWKVATQGKETSKFGKLHMLEILFFDLVNDAFDRHVNIVYRCTHPDLHRKVFVQADLRGIDHHEICSIPITVVGAYPIPVHRMVLSYAVWIRYKEITVDFVPLNRCTDFRSLYSTVSMLYGKCLWDIRMDQGMVRKLWRTFGAFLQGSEKGVL